MAVPKPIKSAKADKQLPLPFEADEQALPSGEHAALPAIEKIDLIAEVIPIREGIQDTMEHAKGSFSFQVEPSLEMDFTPRADYVVHKHKNGDFVVDLNLFKLPFPSHMHELHEATIQLKIDASELNTAKSPEQLIKVKLAEQINATLREYSEKRRKSSSTSDALKSVQLNSDIYRVEDEISRKDKQLTDRFTTIELSEIARDIAQSIA